MGFKLVAGTLRNVAARCRRWQVARMRHLADRPDCLSDLKMVGYRIRDQIYDGPYEKSVAHQRDCGGEYYAYGRAFKQSLHSVRPF